MNKPNLKLVHSIEHRTLPVLTVFYAEKSAKTVTKRIRSGRPLRAMQNCLGHMRRNSYDATLAEVYSTANGRLYGIMVRDVEGNVRVIFEHKPKGDE